MAQEIQEIQKSAVMPATQATTPIEGDSTQAPIMPIPKIPNRRASFVSSRGSFFENSLISEKESARLLKEKLEKTILTGNLNDINDMRWKVDLLNMEALLSPEEIQALLRYSNCKLHLFLAEKKFADFNINTFTKIQTEMGPITFDIKQALNELESLFLEPTAPDSPKG